MILLIKALVRYELPDNRRPAVWNIFRAVTLIDIGLEDIYNGYNAKYIWMSYRYDC